MTAASRISVVLPVHNGEQYLAEALESVAWQTLEPAEIVVVDDGSTDCSGAIARSFAGVRVIRQENAGVSSARNAGIEAATGDVIAFIDADDIWLPDKLARQAAAASDGMVVSLYRTFLSGGLTESPPWYRGEALGEMAIANEPSSWFLPASVFERVGLFDTGYRRGEDWEWLNRARRLGVTSTLCEEVLLLRRLHTSNLSSNRVDTRSAVFRLLRKSAALQRQGGEAANG